MDPATEPSLQMWLTLLLTGGAIVAYAWERLPIELSSIAILGALLLIFQLMPGSGAAALRPEQLLTGFGNPALVAVAALLVVGEAMVNTRALEPIARRLVVVSRGRFHWALLLSLTGAAVSSAFLNNTPVVVIFIPILHAIAAHYGRSASVVMLPLNFAVILGGMTTLIGSSTNLLVSGALIELGRDPLGLFDPTVPGLVLALVGGAYAILVLPRWLPEREVPDASAGAAGRQFLTEVDIGPDSALIGAFLRDPVVPGLPKARVRLVWRGERAFLPPFGDLRIEAGDVLLIGATRAALADLLAKDTGSLRGTSAATNNGGASRFGPSDLILAEAMVKPTSRMVGQTLDLTNFAARSGCTVLAVQRRARILRSRLAELLLEPGDVLLLLERADAMERLRADPDVVLMEWSASEVPLVSRAPVALAILAAVVLPAAFELVPIVITALLGVLALVATGCLNFRQAARAIDSRIILMIATALALGKALEATGGAAFFAHGVLHLLAGASSWTVISVFFLLVAIMTNVLSNNACGVLFTPIAVQLAAQLGVSVMPFALAVIFGANCSFATPIGYQTNLLIMTPGHYRFADFMVAGLPLVILIWLTFSLFVPWYYGV
jgi:di/tricarboxylate transporter